MTKEVKKTNPCPKCGKRIKYLVKPGKKVVVRCLECSTKVSIYFPKKHKRKTKPHAIGVTKKQLVANVATAILVVVLIFGIIIPVMQESLHFLIVLSGSMQPDINPGDIVVTQATNPDNIHVDDVITFRRPTTNDPNRCVTHRVVNITDDSSGISFETKGDANEDSDSEPVLSSNLIGKVAFVIPYIGYLPYFVQQPMGFVVMIIIPCSLFIINEIWTMVKNNKKESGERKQQSEKKPTH